MKKTLNEGTKKERIDLIDQLSDTLSAKNILLLIEAFRNSDWFIRKYASDKIINKFGDKVIAYIVKGMDDENKDISYWSIQTLSKLGQKASESISMKLKRDLNFPNRQFLVRALGQIQDAESIEIFIHLFNDKDLEIRNEAFEAVVTYGNSAVPHLQKVLPKGGNTFCWSIRALARILKEKSIKTLILNYQKATSCRIKNDIIIALGETKSQQALAFLLKLLLSKSWILRNQASDVIVEKFGNMAVKPLNVLFKKGSTDLKYWVLKLIARIMKEKSIPILVNLLKNPSEDIRFYAVTALGDVETEDAIYPLIESFNDRSTVIQKTACEGIIRLGAIAKEEMEDALESSDENVRFWAIKAYARVAGGEYSKFQIIVKNGSKREKLKMIEALKDAHNPESLKILLNCLEDPEWIVRNNSHEAVSKFGTWCHSSLLRAFFTKSNEKKFWIAKIIHGIGSSMTEIVSDFMMETSYENFRNFITERYIDLDIASKKEILTALLAYLNDNEDVDRKKIITLFEELEGKPFLARLAESSNLDNILKILGHDVSDVSVDLGEVEGNESLKALVELIEIENKKIDDGDGPTFSFLKYMDNEKGMNTIIEKLSKNDLTPQEALDALSGISKNDIDKMEEKYLIMLIGKAFFMGLADLRDMVKLYSLSAVFNTSKAMIGDAGKYKKNEIKAQFKKEVKYRRFQEKKNEEAK
ncbi:HEAT repeat domain-containing protein [bacterium]|nr:HEAT repeat domain-containing protein [bacterium]